ncbi:hypothetical protein [Chryseobacterium sp. Mn2064]|uniref:hypothetical protein n=1 Tax=Chryseobacterium sp. Mn2064 TaxID=3395263 RepID=UPI003BD3304C
MENKKLSLDAFKAMAEKVQTEEVMQKIEGGDAAECHGFAGQARKVAREISKAILRSQGINL